MNTHLIYFAIGGLVATALVFVGTRIVQMPFESIEKRANEVSKKQRKLEAVKQKCRLRFLEHQFGQMVDWKGRE